MVVASVGLVPMQRDINNIINILLSTFIDGIDVSVTYIAAVAQ